MSSPPPLEDPREEHGDPPGAPWGATPRLHISLRKDSTARLNVMSVDVPRRTVGLLPAPAAAAVAAAAAAVAAALDAVAAVVKFLRYGNPWGRKKCAPRKRG